MNKLILVIALAPALVLGPISAFASGGHGGSALDSVEVSLADKVSLQNGAKLFVNYCLSCHSANYMRYNRMAADLEIPEDLVEDNMIMNGAKIGDPMTTTMSKDAAEEWFGVAPPDLSLIGKLRDADWLYTYLRSFYLDDSTESGWNNTVFENVAMPHVMYELQGTQKAIFEIESDDNGFEHQVFKSFELVKPGKMSTEEFDHAMGDLTNFLYYMGEPARMVRIKYGMWTMLFLGLLGTLAFMLKKEYWRDVH